VYLESLCQRSATTVFVVASTHPVVSVKNQHRESLLQSWIKNQWRWRSRGWRGVVNVKDGKTVYNNAKNFKIAAALKSDINV